MVLQPRLKSALFRASPSGVLLSRLRRPANWARGRRRHGELAYAVMAGSQVNNIAPVPCPNGRRYIEENAAAVDLAVPAPSEAFPPEIFVGSH